MEQLQNMFGQVKDFLMDAVDMAVTMEMTWGTIMFLGGLIGCVAFLLAIVISLAIFPGQRKRILKKLGQE